MFKNSIFFIYCIPLNKNYKKFHTIEIYNIKHFYDENTNLRNFDSDAFIIDKYIKYINSEFLEYVESIYSYTVFKLNIRKIKINRLLNGRK